MDTLASFIEYRKGIETKSLEDDHPNSACAANHKGFIRACDAVMHYLQTQKQPSQSDLRAALLWEIDRMLRVNGMDRRNREAVTVQILDKVVEYTNLMASP